MAATDIPITKMLAELGVVAVEEVATARAALESAGLTNPRKTNISVEKRAAVVAEIDRFYRRLCVRCAADLEAGNEAEDEAGGMAVGTEMGAAHGARRGVRPGAEPDDPRPVLRVAQPQCTNCGGSNNQRAVDELLAACKRAGVRDVVFVGGSPAVRQELTALLGEALELRLVEGTRSRTRAVADADIAWADLVVVLGTSELAHKVSLLYTDDPAARKKAITVRRRGVEAIAQAITKSDRVSGGR